MRISDWSSDVCSSDLLPARHRSGHCRNDRAANRPAIRASHETSRAAAREIDTRDRSAAASAARLRCHCARTLGRIGMPPPRSEEHTSELQSLMRISYAVFCLKKKNKQYYILTISEALIT